MINGNIVKNKRKIAEKISELFGSDSDNAAVKPTASAIEQREKGECEKERENESDILVLNAECSLLNSSPEKEIENSLPPVSIVDVTDLDVDPDITSLVSLTPIKESALPITPGKTIHANTSIKTPTQDLRAVIEKKRVAPSDITVTITQSVEKKPKNRTRSNANTRIASIRKTHTQPPLEYSENTSKNHTKSLSISLVSQSRAKHASNSHSLDSHNTRSAQISNAYTHSSNLSHSSQSHAIANTQHAYNQPLEQANAHYSKHAYNHSSHSNPLPNQLAYNQIHCNSQSYSQHSIDSYSAHSHSHAYTQPLAIQHPYTQSYAHEYAHSYTPQHAHRPHPYQPITRTLTQLVKRPNIERERQNTRIISLENKHVPNGVHLAIAVSKSKFYSKNALKKITRKLANEFN